MTQPALPTDSIHLTQPGDACAEYILSTHNFPRIHYSLALTHTLTNVLMRGKHCPGDNYFKHYLTTGQVEHTHTPH